MSLPERIRRLIVAWVRVGCATIVALALLTGLLLKDHGWWGYLRLVRGGAVARAVVVRTDRENHCFAEYSFVIAGKSYGGSGADCDAMIGDGVTITYLNADPKLSCLGLARDALWNDLAFLIGSGLIFPPILILGWRRWKSSIAPTS